MGTHLGLEVLLFNSLLGHHECGSYGMCQCGATKGDYVLVPLILLVSDFLNFHEKLKMDTYLGFEGVSIIGCLVHYEHVNYGMLIEIVASLKIEGT